MANAKTFYFDRSRLDTAAHCPREYYWQYAFLGLGIDKLRQLPVWDLLIGTYVHEGVESVLRGVDGKSAAKAAEAAYVQAIQPLLATIELGERHALTMMEFQQATDLVLALVYGWSLIGYPRYNAQYELVDIEREEELAFVVNGHEITMLTRADIISKLRNSDLHIIHNLKTVSNPDKKWAEQWQYDMQTLTERLATETRLGKEIIGVVIEGLAKGSKAQQEWPPGSGFRQHSQPLIWAWADKIDGQQLPGETRGFYGRYEWTCVDPHVLGNGRKCAGNKQHRLSNVNKQRVEESYPGGVFAWIDWLCSNDRSLLEQQFVSLQPIGRSPFEIERWKRQVLPAETLRQQNAEVVNELFLKGDKQAAHVMLDYTFPMLSQHANCWPFRRQCTYFDICWQGADPFDTDKWGPREPNHPAEIAALVHIEGRSGANGA